VEHMDDVPTQLDIAAMLGVSHFASPTAAPAHGDDLGAGAAATAAASAAVAASNGLHVFYLLGHGVSPGMLADQQRQRELMARNNHDSRRLEGDWLFDYDLVQCSLQVGDVVAFQQPLRLDSFLPIFLTHVVPLGDQHLVLVVDSCHSGHWTEQLRAWLREPTNADKLREFRCSVTVQSACLAGERAIGGIFTPLFHRLQDEQWRLRVVGDFLCLKGDAAKWNDFCAGYGAQSPDFCCSKDASLERTPCTEVHGLWLFSDPAFFLYAVVYELGCSFWSDVGDDDEGARMKVKDRPGNPLATTFWNDLKSGALEFHGVWLKPWGLELGKNDPFMKVLVRWPGHPVSAAAGAHEFYTLHVHFDGSPAVGMPGQPSGLKVIKCEPPNTNGIYKDSWKDRKKTWAGQVQYYDDAANRTALLNRVEAYVKAQLVAAGRDEAEWTQDSLWISPNKPDRLHVGPFRARGMTLAQDGDPALTASGAALPVPPQQTH